MPNSISATGLTTATQAELVATFTAAMQAIYGADIDLSSNSPDGQMMMIFIQTVLDNLDLLVQINNQFDPDNAIGIILDQRVAINGIQRQAGTFTITNITLVIAQALNLFGLDQTSQTIFTVADNAGNRFQLVASQSIPAPGTYVFAFQAVNPGQVTTIPNTITVPVTIVLGVTSINNPTVATSTGTNEESDAALRVRRQMSVSLASQGYLAGLLAALENISGVTSAFIYENLTGSTDGDGVPGHSIWVIVAGSGAATDIAEAIYDKRNAGCGMFGTTTYVITQIDGSPFVVAWDDVISENLFIAFKATSLDGINPPNIGTIRLGLSDIFAPGVNAEVNVTALGTAVQELDSNTLVTFSTGGIPATGGFATSVGGSYANTLSPTTKNRQFAIDSSRIIILPMILSPYNPVTATPVQVVALATEQFAALGGYGSYTYAFVTNNSGGSINAGTGLYTAGSIPSTDTISVTDSLSNVAQAVITVV